MIAGFTSFFSGRIISYGVAALMGILALLSFGKSISDYYDGARETVAQTQHQSEAFAHYLDERFRSAQALIDSRLPALERDPGAALAWLEALRKEIIAQDALSIISFGLAFEPNAYAPTQRLFAPMYLKAGVSRNESLTQLPVDGDGYAPSNIDGINSANFTKGDPREGGQNSAVYRLISLHEMVDYTLPHDAKDPVSYDSSWYVLGLNTPKSLGVWQQPYYGEIIQSMLSEYSRPFFGTHPVTGQRQKLGMVYLDLSLAEVRETVQNLQLPAGAYGVLLSDKASVVSHPIRAWLGKPLTETLAVLQPDLAETMTEKVSLGESFIVSFTDPLSDQAFMAIHSSIPSNQWSFGLTLAQDGLYTFAASHRLLVLFSFFTLGLSILAVWIGKASDDIEPLVHGWRISYFAVAWALLMSILILGLFVPLERAQGFIKLLNPTDLVSHANFKPSHHAPEAITIPTGVLVEDIRFLRHDEITVSGLVWQVANAEIHKSILGVQFPRSQPDKTKLKKVFETERQGSIVRGWRFSTTMRYETDIGQYPFDKSRISLAVTPKDRQSNVVLVPDFKAYDFLVPSSLPGIDGGLSLKYWTIRESYFAKILPQEGLSTLDGMHRISVSDDQFNNALVFNIELSRKWLSPIVAYILPVFIGSIMIFIVLMIPHDRSAGIVFSTLSYGSTIYFVISIFHVGLRNSEGIDGLTYLESYYIIMHAMVMLVSLNGFLLMVNKGPSWLFYRDNAVPRMLYWPTITLGLLMMTLIYFAVPSFLQRML